MTSCNIGDYVRFTYRGEERRGTVEKEVWDGVIRLIVIREAATAIRREVWSSAVLEVLIAKQ